jgi:hydrogenase nickel incorporation protein HypA/HybF
VHELSIAMSIVAAVQEESAVASGNGVEAVHVRVGVLSGVVPDALAFSYALATADTALEGSRLVIDSVPATISCPHCDTEQPVVSVQQMCCAVCGTPSAAVVQGRELMVTALEIKPLEIKR